MQCACLHLCVNERRYIRGMGLNGTLPPDWGSDGGLLKLRQLWIDGNNLSGGCTSAACSLVAKDEGGGQQRAL